MTSPDPDDVPSDDSILDAALSGTTAPVVAGAPATPAPEGDTPATPDTPPEGQQATARDEKGRFVSRETPLADGTPSPTDTPPQPDEPASEEPPALDISNLPPLTYKADGKDWSVEGSLVGPDGAFIPTAQIEYVAKQLAEGRRAHQMGREFATRLNDAKAARQSEIEAAEATVAGLQTFVEQFKQLRLDAQQDPQAVVDWLLDARMWDAMQAKAEATTAKQQLERLTKRQQESASAAQQAALQPQMETAFQRYLDDALNRPDIKGLSLKRERLERSLRGRWGDIFRTAGPADIASGFTPGDVVVNYGVIEDAVLDHAALVRELRPAPVKAEARPAIPPPPVVTNKTGATPTRTPPVPTFDNAEDADRFWLSEQGLQHAP